MIALTLAASVALAPLLLWLSRRSAAIEVVADEDALFRTQLSELDSDVAGGRIAADQAGSLRAEIQRRLLRANRTAQPTKPMEQGTALSLLLGIGLSLLAGVGLYIGRGNATLPSSPAPPVATTPAAPQQFAQAQAALLEDPANIPAWISLSDAMAQDGRTRDAVDALTLAGRAMPGSVDLWVARGEALVRHAQGQVTPAARFAFDQASRIAPDHPAPRFYLALAWMQAARPEEALATLEELARMSAPDAPWMDRVNRMMRGARTMMAAGIGKENQTAP
jgi:cytochrome c-type biogenesis protein CcmH